MKDNRLRNFSRIKTVEQAERFNIIIEKKLRKVESKKENIDQKIQDFKDKISKLEEAKYKLENPDRDHAIPYKYQLINKEIEIELTTVSKVAQLGYSTIFLINDEWFKISGRSPTGGFDDITWSLNKLTQDELYWKLSEYHN